jgi:ADP-ribose pyrophosphatase YjhB (NUDIX family)
MGMKILAQLEGTQVVRKFPLLKDSYSMGRSKENDMVFESPKVSRVHARIYRENGEFILQDFNSTNYVFVNGARVKQKSLEVNDRIQLSSEITLLFSEEEETPPEETRTHTVLDIHKHFVHKDDMMRLRRVTKQIISMHSLEDILQNVLKELTGLIGADRGFIALSDGQGQIMWRTAVAWQMSIAEQETDDSRFSHSILREALQSEGMVMRFNEDTSGTAITHSMMSLRLYSVMCTPLLFGGKVVGVLYVDAREVMHNFTEVSQFLFEFFAEHAAIAIANAHRFRQLEARSQHLQSKVNQLEKRVQELENSETPAETPLRYSAGGVVLNPSGEVLVVSQNGTSWSLPKGGLEPWEEGQPEIAARREIYEESGIKQLQLLGTLGDYTRTALGRDGQEDTTERKHITIFLFTTPDTELRPVDADNPEARWVPTDEVAALLTHPADQAFFTSILSQIKAQQVSS